MVQLDAATTAKPGPLQVRSRIQRAQSAQPGGTAARRHHQRATDHTSGPAPWADPHRRDDQSRSSVRTQETTRLEQHLETLVRRQEVKEVRACDQINARTGERHAPCIGQERRPPIPHWADPRDHACGPVDRDQTGRARGAIGQRAGNHAGPRGEIDDDVLGPGTGEPEHRGDGVLLEALLGAIAIGVLIPDGCVGRWPARPCRGAVSDHERAGLRRVCHVRVVRASGPVQA